MRQATERRRAWTLWVLGSVLLLGACRDPARAAGTALYVKAEFDPTLLLTQVRVWGDVEGGSTFGPHVLPDQPERVLHSGETVRVLLGADTANGVRAQVHLEGLRDNTVVARGSGETQVRDGYEVDVTLRLEAVPSGNDTFCLNCEGCCQQGFCASRSFNTCGTGGIACVACDARMANGCDSRGVCVCGASPACSSVTADRCTFGLCRCGGGQACDAGQVCVDGACRCTKESCASGCCSGNTCEPGTNKDKCGNAGDMCRKCARCTANGVCG